MRPVILDLFCGAGGASMGYHFAGFDVVGVDIEPQPNYPFEFVQADAMTFDLRGFDAIHASPPCEAYSETQRINKNKHPELIEPTRERLQAMGVPYIIENVPGAPLINPVTLCGEMFDLGVYRHRLFETSFPVVLGIECTHDAPITKMGRQPKPGHMMHVVGNFIGADHARDAMNIDWMNRNELASAIPPAFTQYLGYFARKALTNKEANGYATT